MPKPREFFLPPAWFTALALWGCGREEYRPSFPDAVLTVHHLGAYSSQMGEDKEVQGTLFQTRWKMDWKKRGDGYLVTRRLDTLHGNGYHKFSLPGELEKKADLDVELGPDRVPRRVTGYDSLHAILRRIPQRDGYREQLLRSSDTVFFQARQRDVFRLRNLLPPGVLTRETRIGVEEINRSLETLRLDSARYQGKRPRLRLSCLEYEVYYHYLDSLALAMEQFFFSSPRHRKWKRSGWDPGTVDGTWHFSLERNTGLPCFESVTEIGRVLLKNAEEKTEQPVKVFRYEEDLYVR